MRFLVVDDDERVALLLSKKLAAYGECVLAGSGEDALARFAECYDAGQPFQAVFMDIKMPGMDGHEVVRRMRELESRRGKNPLESFKLVMISAFSDPKNVCQSFFQGQADAFVAKADIKDSLVRELKAIKLI
ncbi:MAG TPA: hypothetical protein DDW80_03950 [Desulfovibrio sp.]|jgi:two-component system chemotaxis response regulator CheY|nr:hypothetical protein [Desulfovibrio sp.]